MTEERIFIAKLGGRNCPVETNDNICLLGCSCEFCNGGLSRQEAIERMAKAMCQSLNHCGPCRYKNDKEKCEAAIDFHWGFAAKAALNALLEEQNER